MKDNKSTRNEQNLSLHLSNAREIQWRPEDKWLVYSDLHMGNGGRSDDFARNGEMFNATLRDYYLPRGYKLILNGDVEELHKFSLRQIYKRWKSTYALFDRFAENDSLYKTVGNHDSRLIMDLRESYPYSMDTVLSMKGLDLPVLFYHGHQISAFYEKFNDISRIGLRYFAMPLGIMNKSVAHDSRRRHYLEKRIYEYSHRQGIVSVIGHTHRPLFESLTKADSLRFQIEYLLTLYREASESTKQEIEKQIDQTRDELVDWRRRIKRPELQSGLYAEYDVPIPCVFNSGTVISKHGMTCLEFSGGKIRLVHWYGEDNFDRHSPDDSEGTIAGGKIRRKHLREAESSYVMDSIRLLS